MFHPFAPFTGALLEAFVKSGKMYYVRQTYSRRPLPLEAGIKGYFIITHYAEIGHAQHHFGAISNDPAKFVYEWDKMEHRQKLTIAAGNPAGFKIYSSVFDKNWQQQVSNSLKEQVKKYIDNTLRWLPGRGETVSFEIYVNYGELYAKLKLRTQEVRVKLEHIETG